MVEYRTVYENQLFLMSINNVVNLSVQQAEEYFMLEYTANIGLEDIFLFIEVHLYHIMFLRDCLIIVGSRVIIFQIPAFSLNIFSSNLHNGLNLIILPSSVPASSQA